MNASRALVTVLFVVVVASAASAVTVTLTGGAAAVAAVARVNINTAGVKELMTLEGVGRALAERIIEHRTANGSFKKPTDLRKVPGVGADLWEKNRERIVVK
jgi:competence protein ComEA